MKFMLKIVLMLFVGCCSLCGCQNNAEQKTRGDATAITAIAKKTVQITRLYFKGTLLPIRTMSVLSPVDGVIDKMHFHYGAMVKKGDPLVSIQATKSIDTFRTALGDYLQKKSAMQQQVQKYEGDKALYAAGVLSQQDFLAAGDTYATSILNFNQSRYALDKIVLELKMTPKEIENLEIANTQQVADALQQSVAHLLVRAPETGVVLIPLQTNGDSNSGKQEEGANEGSINKILQVGSEVQAQQTIISLGDLTGYQVSIQVSELDIVRIRPGLSVLVTGEAFPGIVLNGVVQQVSVQANPNPSAGGSGMSMYDVLIHIPKVAEKNQPLLRVGMTAKVEIHIKNPPQIIVPFGAVVNKRGRLTATIIDAKTHQPHDVSVETGAMFQNDVVIVKGIKAGDQVVVHSKVEQHAGAI